MGPVECAALAIDVKRALRASERGRYYAASKRSEEIRIIVNN